MALRQTKGPKKKSQESNAETLASTAKAEPPHDRNFEMTLYIDCRTLGKISALHHRGRSFARDQSDHWFQKPRMPESDFPVRCGWNQSRLHKTFGKRGEVWFLRTLALAFGVGWNSVCLSEGRYLVSVSYLYDFASSPPSLRDLTESQWHKAFLLALRVHFPEFCKPWRSSRIMLTVCEADAEKRDVTIEFQVVQGYIKRLMPLVPDAAKVAEFFF